METKQLHFGAAYYPEHWPESRWPEDIGLMRAAGMTVARLAEFAWSTLEPAPGQFCFDWLDRAIDQLAAAGIVSVLGTPTAAPPAWLTQAHPDTLAVDESGRRVQHGNRCHYCVNSTNYHAATQRIVTALAQHFGANPHVIGWQIDNEFCRFCYCDTCQQAFRRYLAERYETLTALNTRWSTAYWSQTYSDWEQIPLPRGGHNPGLMLEFRRFISHGYRRFQRLQIDALRAHLRPDVWITHNYMGWHDGIDHYELAADLDLASWDWYIGTGYHKYLDTGALHDWVRGFKRRNFWLMETQPGHVNWAAANNSLRRGEARKMAWHAIGHGADAILYWQWRSALNGQEQYHGALLDQAGQPRPFYAEAQQLGAELAQVSAALAGTRVVSPVALLFDYPSRWSLGWQAHHKNFDYIEHLLTYYRPLAARNIPVDIVSQDAPLDDYAVVIAPALLMLKPETAARLLPLVKNKGLRLVLTARCGMKDEYNALLPLRQPGWLADLAGVEVEDYYVLLQPVPVTGLPAAAQASIWAERLKLRAGSRAEVLARYGAGDGWLDDQPAITVTDYAPGQVYYVGAQLDAAGMEAFFNRVLSQVPLPPGLPAPAGVEVCPRTAADGRNLLITINHERFEQTVPLPWAAHDLLSGQTVSGALKLAPYGVAVLDRTRAR